MEKVRVLVEERVQGRVRQVVQREVYATVCEMQAVGHSGRAPGIEKTTKYHTVPHPSGQSFLPSAVHHVWQDHSDLCFRSLVWALSPNSTGLFARTLRLIWCCRRRFTRFSAWMLGVPDRRRDILRARLELMQHVGAMRNPETNASREGPEEKLTVPGEEAVEEASQFSEDSATEAAPQASPLHAAQDLQRTAEELVAAALGTRRPEGERPRRPVAEERFV
eukprot:g18965.t1